MAIIGPLVESLSSLLANCIETGSVKVGTIIVVEVVNESVS